MAGEAFAGVGVAIGKTDNSGAILYLSALSPPSDFAWLRYLNVGELVEFFNELLSVLHRARETDEWLPVAEMVENWRATAELCASAELTSAIKEGERQLAGSQGRSWGELRQELDL